MADPRRTLRLLAALRSRVRWRSGAGVTRSALVAGMVTASLAITTGLVAYGPEVGSAVADRFVCVLGSTDCGQPDAAEQSQPPPARVLTQQSGGALGGSYDLAGVANPTVVGPGAVAGSAITAALVSVDIESQLPLPTQGFFGRLLNHLWGGHED